MLQTRQIISNYKYTPKVTDAGFDISKQVKPKDLLTAMNHLDGLQLKDLKERFDARYEELCQKDRNFMLQDFVGDYVYVVYTDEENYHMYCKGKQAYDYYKEYGIKIERKTKDLFPTYKTVMEKDKEIRNEMSKADYDREYDRLNRKQIKFVLNKNTDQDVIEQLEKQENKSGYLKELIRQDIKKSGQ